jgi:hypothetical protein
VSTDASVAFRGTLTTASPTPDPPSTLPPTPTFAPSFQPTAVPTPTLPPTAIHFLMIELAPQGECRTATGGSAGLLIPLPGVQEAQCKAACLATLGCGGITVDNAGCTLHAQGTVATTSPSTTGATCFRKDPVQGVLSCLTSNTNRTDDTAGAANTVTTPFRTQAPDHVYFFSAPIDGVYASCVSVFASLILLRRTVIHMHMSTAGRILCVCTDVCMCVFGDAHVRVCVWGRMRFLWAGDLAICVCARRGCFWRLTPPPTSQTFTRLERVDRPSTRGSTSFRFFRRVTSDRSCRHVTIVDHAESSPLSKACFSRRGRTTW